MANHAKYSGEMALIKPRHGKKGDVVIQVGVPPDVKDSFVAKSERTGKTLKELYNEAFVYYLGDYP